MSQYYFTLYNRCKDSIYVDGEKVISGEKRGYPPGTKDYSVTWKDSLGKKYVLEINEGSFCKINRTASKEIKIKVKDLGPGNEKNDTVTIEDNEDDGGEE